MGGGGRGAVRGSQARRTCFLAVISASNTSCPCERSSARAFAKSAAVVIPPEGKASFISAANSAACGAIANQLCGAIWGFSTPRASIGRVRKAMAALNVSRCAMVDDQFAVMPAHLADAYFAAENQGPPSLAQFLRFADRFDHEAVRSTYGEIAFSLASRRVL